MSGPPGSQLAVRNKKRSGKGNHRDPVEGVASPSVDSHRVNGLSWNSNGRRQENAHVEVFPLRHLYERAHAIFLAEGNLDHLKRKKLRVFNDSFLSLPFPRGMLNNSNFCFINSILQCLAFIPPVVQLAISVFAEKDGREHCPILCALAQWILQYWKPGLTRASIAAPQLLSPPQKSGRLNISTSFAQNRLDGSVQEDAQEYLQRVLEVIQMELIKLEDHLAGSASSEVISTHQALPPDNSKGWKMVKGKEKQTIRRHRHIGGQSYLINEIFGGTLESHLQGKNKSKHEVSVTIERYFTLPIDVGFSLTCTVEEALERTLSAERIRDEMSDRNLIKTLRLHTLPNILLLQLRRWAVTAEGELVKLDNVVQVRRSLQIPRNVCTDDKLSNKDRSYRLLSVVCHRGSATGRGHYVTYLASHVANPRMSKGCSNADGASSALESTSAVLCNDTVLSITPLKNVEKESAYFLVYQRAIG